MFKNMVNALIPAKLTETCGQEKGDVIEGIKYLVVGGIIFFAAMIVDLELRYQGMLDIITLVLSYVRTFIAAIIPTIIVFYLMLWISHFLIAKLLKGKAAFPQLFFLASVLQAAIIMLDAAVTTVIGIITMISFKVGVLLIIPADLLIMIWGLYLFYTLFKSVYGFKMKDALLALIIYFLLVEGAVNFLKVLIHSHMLLSLGALRTTGAMGMQPAS